MREIKFRAWDKINKLISSVTILDFADFNREVSILNSKGHFNCLMYDIELMQYTGLKDSKCVEIYEGDIMQGTSYEDKTIKGFVTYRSGSFYVDWSSCNYPPQLLFLSHDEDEVIGNIYKNKNLLKETELVTKIKI